MGAGALGYLAFGVALVALFVAIVAHYYAKGRHGRVEQAKYRMLDDEEGPDRR